MNASEQRVKGIIEQMKLEVIRLEAQKELLGELIAQLKSMPKVCTNDDEVPVSH